MLTGTDEHGEPVVLAAEKEGLTPRELGDKNAPRFRELMSAAGVDFDFFIRTTDPEHEAKVQEILQRVYDNGHVYAGKYEGWYCPRCADFKTENEIGPDNTCPIHKIPLDWQQEDNWFFRLSAFQEPLERLYTERPDFVGPQSRYNEALAFIRQGLQDVSLSRSKITWGVRVPWDESQVFYVWFDALLNYITAFTYAQAGRGPCRKVLAGRLPAHRQGHPQVPRRLLAGPAHGRRLRGPAAPLHPRLPAHAGREDVQVPGQRARPAHGDRALRRRRAALLLLPRGDVRLGRLRLHRGVRDALRDGAGQRAGQPRLAHTLDDAALPGRRRARGGARLRRWRATSTGWPSASPSCWTERS